MNEHSNNTQRYWPLMQLILARVREFYREPEAIFWVYGFPLIIVVALGIAFRERPVEQFAVDIEEGPAAEAVRKVLEGNATFKVQVNSGDRCRLRLKTGKTALVVVLKGSAPLNADGGGVDFSFDPTRPESLLARSRVDDALQRAAGRKDPVPTADREMTEPGSRYVDFLVPGLLGMSLMGGGLWGVGFVTVDMRIRKVLRRFVATPMRRRDFLLAILISRLIFMVPEVLLLLVFAHFVFDVVIQGSILAVAAMILLGALAFSGLGLLIGCRAKTMEAVSGLMNLVMLPMWVLSGIFFSSERFPDAAQPFIKALPLTPLIDALRAIILEGQGLLELGAQIGILTAWAVVTSVLALRWFRWS